MGLITAVEYKNVSLPLRCVSVVRLKSFVIFDLGRFHLFSQHFAFVHWTPCSHTRKYNLLRENAKIRRVSTEKNDSDMLAPFCCSFSLAWFPAKWNKKTFARCLVFQEAINNIKVEKVEAWHDTFLFPPQNWLCTVFVDSS